MSEPFNFVPRWYQGEAVDSVFDYFGHSNGNPLILLPTGTGKSWIPAMLMERILKQWPRQKMMLISHVEELIEQDLEKLLLLWPTAPVGVCCAGLGRHETGAPLTCGTVGSMVSRAELFGHVDLIVIDEAHLVSPKDSTMYRHLINKLLEVNPKLKVIGLTATNYRLGSGLLTDDDQLFDDVCYDQCTPEGFARFVEEGYLAPLVPRGKPVGSDLAIDVDGVPMRMGDFAKGALDARIDDELLARIVTDILANGADRKSWLTFCTSIDSSEKVAQYMTDGGVKTLAVHSKMPKKLRKAAIRDFKRGIVRSLTNQGVLTTGHDFPRLDLINMLRPTQSASLWVQMLGRGTRPNEEAGKKDCLVLDYAGNGLRLGPIDNPTVPKKKKKGPKQPAPMKLCANTTCLLMVPASARVCGECGYEFPIIAADEKLTSHAANVALMGKHNSVMPEIEAFEVHGVKFRKKQKKLTKKQYDAGHKPKPPYLNVEYRCGFTHYSENIYFESSYSGTLNTAFKWWQLHAAEETNHPATVDQALELISNGALYRVSHVKVWVNAEPYPEVKNYAHDKTRRTDITSLADPRGTASAAQLP